MSSYLVQWQFSFCGGRHIYPFPKGSALIAFSDWHLVVDHINTLCVVNIIVIIIVITIIIMFIITTLECIGVNV